MLSEEQLEYTRTRIGGTKASIVLGLNPYMTPYDLGLVMLGLVENNVEGLAVDMGNLIEPSIAKWYAKERGYKIQYPIKETTVYEANPIAIANPDILNIETIAGVPLNSGADCKCTGFGSPFSANRTEFGVPFTDQVPKQYLIQANWYAGIFGKKSWDIPLWSLNYGQEYLQALIDMFELFGIEGEIRDQLVIDFVDRICKDRKIYTIEYNDSLFNYSMEAATIFMKNLEKKILPEVDHGKLAREYLNRNFSIPVQELREPTDADNELREKHRQALVKKKEIENEVKAIKNQIIASIKGYGGIQFDGKDKTTYKADKNGIFKLRVAA